MDAQRFASTLTTVPPHRAVVQSRFPQALPMCGSLLFPELPSTSVGNAVAAPPVLAALFPPPHSSNTAYHSALYSTSGGVLDCGALDGTFSVLPHHQSPSPVLFPTPASYDLDNYRTGAQEGSCYPRFNGGYGAHEEGRRDGILGWGSAPQNRTPVRAPVLDLPILQPSPAVSSSHNQEAWWKRRCLCVTCKALPDSRNEDFSAGEGEMLPTVHTKAGGVKSSQGHRKATQEPFSIPEGSTWDELVWRWLKQLGMENEVEEILCPGAQRVLVMWSSDQAAEHWRAKMGVTAFNASQLVVFENTLLKWS
ncbi:hypothetical protein ABL78_1469 [Leptomonas seymouri]|uniref:Uncharacterized protein n=1 Tax=Leptomonas seymouri TaxID=5684 RepID=A0A0N1PFV0_LEPSE|nr:hypothetical protein ABL78_1469 [Leptomonas seymouri]|eukprot:KPI89433.1 hypothetical protein ABL78_1469 [Leptomonas seymouri]